MAFREALLLGTLFAQQAVQTAHLLGQLRSHSAHLLF
jgi:hypothetical protein